MANRESCYVSESDYACGLLPKATIVAFKVIIGQMGVGAVKHLRVRKNFAQISPNLPEKLQTK